MIIKLFFEAHFVQKQTKEKFPILDQNDRLTPLLNQRCYSLGGLVSSKNKPGGPKSWVSRFEKYPIWPLCKIIFLVWEGFFPN